MPIHRDHENFVLAKPLNQTTWISTTELQKSIGNTKTSNLKIVSQEVSIWLGEL